MTNSEPRTGESRNKGLGTALADPEVDHEKTSRQRVKARISTSTKQPGNRQGDTATSDATRG